MCNFKTYTILEFNGIDTLVYEVLHVFLDKNFCYILLMLKS